MLIPRLALLYRLGQRHLAASQINNYHSKSGVYGHKPEKKIASTVVTDDANRKINANIFRLVEAYRKHGHKKAALDPLQLQTQEEIPELSLERYGLKPDSPENFKTSGIFNTDDSCMTVSELVQNLETEYCGHLAAEFDYLETEEEREWFAQAFETKRQLQFSAERKTAIANLMLKCQAFDNFLANKFTTVKRYGGEGGESMMAVFDEIFWKSSQSGISDVVICMPHRGRLNFLSCMLKFPPVVMYRKMLGKTELPAGSKGTADVLSHLYTSADLQYGDNEIHVSLIPNPSHLEANNPVAAGKTRAKQQTLKDGHYSSEVESRPGDKVLCLQVHGDASFAAQGVVAETFVIAECPHFSVGGSVHLIVNNQVGFTTEPERGRSSRYSSDLAKMNNYPVLHVNADSPEDVIRAAAIAMDYRNKFRKDVVIDYICYRKWGHNELDDPSFTQPIMYNAIKSRDSIPNTYVNKIVEEGLCDKATFDQIIQSWNEELSKSLSSVHDYVPQQFHLQKQWSGLVQASSAVSTWDTGVPVETLKFVGAQSVRVPDEITVHPTIKKTHIDRRLQKLTQGLELDWATAEALAFGSLLYQGFNVRISGQDVGRGTFSHRHGMIVDQENDHICIPLNNLSPDQKGFLELANSALTEEAALGFEYGISIDNPNNLVIWEAQFGDFFNGAQIIIDTYISSGEDKWLLQSGLVMLLPHGMDGAGPEHSSCRMERFLQMTDSNEHKVDGDDINMQIANPTTPAQYFHLLRQQMVRNFRKPLVVVAPKVLLRLPAATSSLSEMAPGTSFKPVLSDPKVKSDKVTKVVFCSGKHYYTLDKERDNRKMDNIAFVRLESLAPFPTASLQSELMKFPNAKDFIWGQEEHRNMGAWTFVAPRFENLVGVKLRYVGRDHLGVPATGVGDIHKAESQKLLEDTFA